MKRVFLGTKAAIPEMRKAGGSIINISSIYGLMGSVTSSAYHASKGAVRIFNKSTAIQYASENIWANSVHPGLVDSPRPAPTMTTPTSPKKGLPRCRWAA